MTTKDNGPRITLFLSDLEDSTLRRVKQLGVDHVCMRKMDLPWTEAGLTKRMERPQAAGLELALQMISGFPRAIYGREGRDAEIEDVCASIRAAGRVGLPVV